jgi:hypothetical protein
MPKLYVVLLSLWAFATVAPANVSQVIHAGADRDSVLHGGQSRLHTFVERVGLRTLRVPARRLAAVRPVPRNLCENRAREGFPRPTASSCSVGYGDCLWAAIDGVPWPGEYEWSNDYHVEGVPWYRVEFQEEREIAEIRLFTRREYPLTDFTVILETAGGDVTVAEVEGNDAREWRHSFEPLSASALRVICHRGPDHQPTIRRIQELQAFGSPPPPLAEPLSFTYGVEVPEGGPVFVEVREVYAHASTLTEVDYEVRVDGGPVHTRRYRCDGPGPVSYAFELTGIEPGPHELAFVDTSGAGVAINRVRLITDPVGTARERGLLKPFVIAPRITLHPPFDDPEYDAMLAEWVEALEPARPLMEPGVLAIVGYAAHDAETVRARIVAYADLAKRHGVPWILQLSSWWADTPLRVADGLGGHFGDVRYQQIGWSELDTYHDPGLREYMESVAPGSYDVRYGLTVPNIWSSTPWLTMNDERLNAYKMERLREAVAVVNEIQQRPEGNLLRAIVTDDEPMYWPRITDWMAGGYESVNGGVRRSDLILDVNPSVVADAAEDGVDLDPSDGLSQVERLWLHENNARYVEMVCGALRESLQPRPARSAGADLRERIFNYILAQPCYPLDDYGHPGWELGIVPGAAVGLESFDEYYFERARELGPLANSDMECANPTPEAVLSWEPRFQAWHEVGCEFIQLCNPGPAENWTGLFERVAGWDGAQRTTDRALSALMQEAAIDEWRQASYRDRFVPAELGE